MNSVPQTIPTIDTNNSMSSHGVQNLQIVGIDAQPVVERRSTTIAQVASEESSVPTTGANKRTCRMGASSAAKMNKRTCRMGTAKVAKINKRTPEFRVLQTENASLNVLVAAKNIESGLNKGETVVLVCEERPEVIEGKFDRINADVKAAIKSGQLVIISMSQTKQDPYEMSVNSSYRQMFTDLNDFVRKPIGRIVVLELDKYLDLASEYRAIQSMQEFYEAAGAVDCPVLTQVVHDESVASELLVKVSREVTSRFFSLVKDNNQLRLSGKTTLH
ncbi:MAG: Unknown protein [uncultured Thiotrichaceae bacterium]|uniref:Uncharacterized protein n=1 Tax=uncultured Thiotrichaceae bacterium TaxID=298394 RepID=A0A6S6TZA1_9GAMM|nr:MAG: Unknown protein [uncultured Thiotrichaceae bacterium]